MGDVDNIDQNDESGAVFQHSACSGGAQRFGLLKYFGAHVSEISVLLRTIECLVSGASLTSPARAIIMNY